MTRSPLFICLVFASFVLFGADGCSSDPNVEGAKLDLRNKDYDRALQNLETALQTDPDNVDALELKGRVIGEMILGIRDIAGMVISPEENSAVMVLTSSASGPKVSKSIAEANPLLSTTSRNCT